MADGSSSSGMVGARRGGVRGWPRTGRGWLAEMGDAVVGVFFPSGCRICERLLTSASRVPLCVECLASFERVPDIICEVCGRPLPGLAQKEGEPLLCPACQDRTHAFDRARSFAVYQDAVVRAILLLKFEQIEPLGAWFAERLWLKWWAPKEIGWQGTWWSQYPGIARESGRGGTTKRPYSPNRWRKGSDCRI